MDDNKILQGIGAVVAFSCAVALRLLLDLPLSTSNHTLYGKSNNPPSELKLEMYELAHRYYMSGDYKSSMHLIDSCLNVAPQWTPAITLKKLLEGRMNSDNPGARLVGGLVCHLLSSKK